MVVRILGLQDGINASACLLEDGVLRFALQEERFSGIKEHIGFPYKSIDQLLKCSGHRIDQIDLIALATDYVIRSPSVEGHTSGMAAHRAIKDATPARVWTWWDETLAPTLKLNVPGLAAKMLAHRNAIRFEPFKKIGYDGPIEVVDHHVAHGAAAYYTNPWPTEPVLVLTADASGDGLCATASIGAGGAMSRFAETRDVNSLGILYTAVTKMMGMKAHSHEFKIMGLAPYAKEGPGEKSYTVFDSYLGLSDDGLRFQRKTKDAIVYLYRRGRLPHDLAEHRFDSIAYGVQKLQEELMVRWVQACIKKTGIHRVVAGGGSFMNVKSNARILGLPEVDDIYIVPSSGDESTSIGAAYYVNAMRAMEAGEEVRPQPLGPLYLGDDFTDKDVEYQIRYGPWAEVDEAPPFDVQHYADVDAEAADLIIKGEIVARCRGPMEFGARALGNRSILCDASDLRVVREINSAIKSRDFWMPFAPVILKRRQYDYLINPKGHGADYMVMGFDTTPLARKDLLAAIHQADLTARPQVLAPGWNPGYGRILESFEEETGGSGGLLNTSFNLHGEPNVHGPAEALRTFLNSGLRYMVLGDFLFSKR